MTDLDRKPVIRRCRATYGRQNRRIVVGLFPGDLLRFREEKSRTWFDLPIGMAYSLAVKAEVDRKRREKRNLRKKRLTK